MDKIKDVVEPMLTVFKPSLSVYTLSSHCGFYQVCRKRGTRYDMYHGDPSGNVDPENEGPVFWGQSNLL